MVMNSDLKHMRRVSIIWGLLLVLIFGLLTTFGIIFNKKNKLYTDMEKDLEEATKKYVERSFSYPKDKEELKVTYTELKDSKLIEELKVEKEPCDGYVIVKKNDLVYKYKGYVKCPDYKTKNYEE